MKSTGTEALQGIGHPMRMRKVKHDTADRDTIQEQRQKRGRGEGAGVDEGVRQE
jgi:hypothetical protein